MGTRNYYTEDAEATYSLEPDLSDENFEEWKSENIGVFEEDWSEDMKRESFERGESEFFYEDLNDWVCPNILEELDNIFSKSKIKTRSLDGSDYNRNFHGTIFGSVYYYKVYSDGIEYGFDISLILRSGYYEGANLDFKIELQIDGYENDVDDMPIGVMNNLEKAKRIINKIYSEKSRPLHLVGTFSDGTGVYRETLS